MATRKAIIQSMAILRANGVKGGPPDRGAIDLVVATWEATFADVDDKTLERAVFTFLRDPKVCQFWPQPGVLLERVPGRAASQVDDADEAWGEVTGWIRKHAITIQNGGCPIPPWMPPAEATVMAAKR